MAKRARGGEKNRPIVVKRAAPPAGHAHHGGAWKIAYADFVTAMMAFFLLMWLINATTEAQRRGIADYFAPTNPLSRGQSGSGLPFGGRSLHSSDALVGETPMTALPRAGRIGGDSQVEEEEDDPAAESRDMPARPATLPAQVAEGPAPQPAAPRRDELAATGQPPPNRAETIARVSEEIRQAVQMDPALASLARQLLIEEVPEGLRVQLLDAEGQPVFQTGQAAPNERGRALLARVAAVIARLPHPIEITGHTDATPFRTGGERSNWDLSAERANATRRLLSEVGIPESRIRSVSGRAEREPLVASNPFDPANRRVALLMLVPGRTGALR
jgi:chemotaxis protein MotB